MNMELTTFIRLDLYLSTNLCLNVPWFLPPKYIFFKMYSFYLYKYTVAVFRHTPEECIRSYYRWLWLCGCWELNSEPLEEQSVLFSTEPSLQPLKKILILKKNWNQDKDDGNYVKEQKRRSLGRGKVMQKMKEKEKND